jgi:protein SCO1/2
MIARAHGIALAPGSLRAVAYLAFAGMAGASGIARAQAPLRPEIPPGTGGEQMALRDVGVDERFDSAVPRDARFRDHEGRTVTLGDFLDGQRPVILQFVYHSCATVCDMSMNNVAAVLTQQPWTIGVEYDVITLSMDPHDTPAVAAAARGRLLGRYGREEAATGWHFLVGDEDEILRVADAVGYHFRWDAPTQQFAHPATLMILQSSGRVARYLYGIDFAPNDVRLALLEGADDRSITTAERVMQFCFRYDAHDSRYVLAAWNLMRAGGVLTMTLLFGGLALLWRREMKKGRSSSTGSSTGTTGDSKTSTASSRG